MIGDNTQKRKWDRRIYKDKGWLYEGTVGPVSQSKWWKKRWLGCVVLYGVQSDWFELDDRTLWIVLKYIHRWDSCLQHLVDNSLTAPNALDRSLSCVIVIFMVGNMLSYSMLDYFYVHNQLDLLFWQDPMKDTVL